MYSVCECVRINVAPPLTLIRKLSVCGNSFICFCGALFKRRFCSFQDFDAQILSKMLMQVIEFFIILIIIMSFTRVLPSALTWQTTTTKLQTGQANRWETYRVPISLAFCLRRRKEASFGGLLIWKKQTMQQTHAGQTAFLVCYGWRYEAIIGGYRLVSF